MAALANIYTKVMEKHPKAIADLRSAARPLLLPPAQAQVNSPKALLAVAPLRAFANEDIYFYVKPIDNSGVVRAADPREGRQAWKMIGGVGFASLGVIGMLMAGAYSLLAGYRVQDLQKEHARLQQEHAELDVQSMAVMGPEIMEKLAHDQFETDPSLQKLVYLDSPLDGTKDKANGQAVASARVPASVASAKQ